MADNPQFCAGCERLGMHLGIARARVLELELELRLRDGHRRDTPRRDVLASPLLNRATPHATW